jgi:hypothetical protein
MKMYVRDLTRPESLACSCGKLEMQVNLHVDTLKTDVNESTSTMNAQWRDEKVDPREHTIASPLIYDKFVSDMQQDQ